MAGKESNSTEAPIVISIEITIPVPIPHAMNVEGGETTGKSGTSCVAHLSKKNMFNDQIHDQCHDDCSVY